MIQQFQKKLAKICGRHFTFIVIPNSANQRIRNFRIPLGLMVLLLLFITLNIYIFFAYSTQVWQINCFRQRISVQNQLIAKLKAEKSRVAPILNKNHYFETQFAQYRQDNQAMVDTWKRIRQKGNLPFVLSSRGFFNRNTKLGSFVYTPMPQPINTSLDRLEHNLDQLKPILNKEIGEQKKLFNELEAYERHLDHRPSLWPVYAQICSSFGMRFHPIYRKYILHEGVDLAAEYGTKVRATADGIVKFADWEAGYGLMVAIDHDYGYETRYGHNSRLLVHSGETVKKGQIISLSGNTGESTGPHVHYEVRINGKPVNPVPFLKE